MRQFTKEMHEALQREAIVVRPDGTWTTLVQHEQAVRDGRLTRMDRLSECPNGEHRDV